MDEFSREGSSSVKNRPLPPLFALSLVMVLLFLLILGCQAESKSDSSENSSEKIKIVSLADQDPDSLDPHKMVASGTEEILLNLFEGLLKPSPSGELIPAVAESYTISDDGREYSFVLREGIRFHNGEFVTLDDLLFSYRRLRGDFNSIAGSTATSTARGGGLKGVEISLSADGDGDERKAILFTLPERDSTFPLNLTEAVIPAGREEEEYSRSPIGTGPYQWGEYRPSSYLRLEKFDEYWLKDSENLDESTPIDTVEFRFISDEQTALFSLLAGEIDLYPRFLLENIERIDDDLYYEIQPQNMVQMLAMNNKVAPLDDLRVRQAINYAVDVDTIIQIVANGRATKLGSHMSPVMSLYYEPGLENIYDLDLSRSKALLLESGYPDGFSLSITVPSNYDFLVRVAEVITEQLKMVQIDASIELVEWGVWLDTVYQKREYEMTVIGFTGKLDPYEILYRYQSDYDRNLTNFENGEFDEILRQAKKSLDLQERIALYQRAQRLLSEFVPGVYLMDPSFAVVLNRHLKGYQSYPIYFQDISKLRYER